MRDDSLTLAQMALPPGAVVNRTRRDYLRSSRWWQLEALRGCDNKLDTGETSAEASLRYAENMKWAAELAREYGAGTWLELKAKHEESCARWRLFCAAWVAIGKRLRRDMRKLAVTPGRRADREGSS